MRPGIITARNHRRRSGGDSGGYAGHLLVVVVIDHHRGRDQGDDLVLPTSTRWRMTGTSTGTAVAGWGKDWLHVTTFRGYRVSFHAIPCNRAKSEESPKSLYP